ncbi:hypothetical protein BDN71DRAFT_1435841 [Pleurotus eryngii]|uniref:Uncharacterized protein n=1 Tax=Pleurotus eryngii TaxID=5323 RepID=A0A9P5ZKQ2_PLEER|nr:hypothetical protein BDN71DRAFT_1435841 [Pleurotus eryngii]
MCSTHSTSSHRAVRQLRRHGTFLDLTQLQNTPPRIEGLFFPLHDHVGQRKDFTMRRVPAVGHGLPLVNVQEASLLFPAADSPTIIQLHSFLSRVVSALDVHEVAPTQIFSALESLINMLWLENPDVGFLYSESHSPVLLSGRIESSKKYRLGQISSCEALDFEVLWIEVRHPDIVHHSKQANNYTSAAAGYMSHEF